MVTTGHPNATRAALTGVLVDILDRINNHYAWAHLSSSDTLLVGVGIIGAVLWIGREGLVPAVKGLLWGGLFGSKNATATVSKTVLADALAPAAAALPAEPPAPVVEAAPVEPHHPGRVAEPPQPAE